MLKKLVISIIFVAALLAFYNHFSAFPETHFDEEIVNMKLSDATKVVGYRVSKGGATVPFYYHYYFIGTSDHPIDKTPFMITETDNVEIESNGASKIQIKMKGKIIYFENEAWAKTDNQLHSLKIDINAQY